MRRSLPTRSLVGIVVVALVTLSLAGGVALARALPVRPPTDQPSCPVVWAAAGPGGAAILPLGIADNQLTDLFIAVPRSSNSACAGQRAVLTITVRHPSAAPQVVYTAPFTFPRPNKPAPPPLTVVWLDGATPVAYYTFTATVTAPNGAITYGTTVWGTVLVGVAMHNALCKIHTGPNTYQSAVCDGAYFPQVGP